MNSIKGIWAVVRSFWKNYPVITGKDTLCAYYRKQNKTIAAMYISFLVLLISLECLHILALLMNNPYNSATSKVAYCMIFLNIGQVIIMVRILKWKNISEIAANKFNYEIQYVIRIKLHYCAFLNLTSFMISTMTLRYLRLQGDPFDLLWMLMFLIHLFCCIWLPEELKFKLLILAFGNLWFCLTHIFEPTFADNIAPKIINPVIIASIIIVAHDRNVKQNFMLKHRQKGLKEVYKTFLQKLQDPIVILDKNHIVFQNDSAISYIGNSIQSFYNKANKCIDENNVSLEISVMERLIIPNISADPIKVGKYFLQSDSDSLKRTIMVTLIESVFFSREKTVSLIFRDITNEILDEQKKLEDKYKNMMLFSLSHELRTPLNILQGVIDLTKRVKKNPEQERCYKSGKGAWNHLRNKINDTLVYAQFLAGEFTFHCTQFNIRKFVIYMQKLATFLLQQNHENLRLVFEVSKEIPEIIHGDKERIEQVIFNLIQNAIKFTEKGTISLKVTLENSQIVFSVTDTGCGLSESVMNIFSQKSGTKPKARIDASGLGLGLTVSRMICEKMGEGLAAFSKVGQGTIFKFTLNHQCTGWHRDSGILNTTRIPDEDAILNPVIRDNKIITGNSQGNSPRPQKIIVLIVDDTDFNRLVAKRMVEKFKIHVEEASDGAQAIKKFDEIKQNYSDHQIIILMDLDMPIMNGIEATRKIREKYKDSFDPYISALTAFASEIERSSCLEAGMNDFMSKPLTKDNLQTLLKNFGVDFT